MGYTLTLKGLYPYTRGCLVSAFRKFPGGVFGLFLAVGGHVFVIAVYRVEKGPSTSPGPRLLFVRCQVDGLSVQLGFVGVDLASAGRLADDVDSIGQELMLVELRGGTLIDRQTGDVVNCQLTVGSKHQCRYVGGGGADDQRTCRRR